MKLFIIGLLIGMSVGRFGGWVTAHQMVAKECELSGGFFVGKQTFKCSPTTGEDSHE